MLLLDEIDDDGVDRASSWVTLGIIYPARSSRCLKRHVWGIRSINKRGHGYILTYSFPNPLSHNA
jgi:hypothetical protein